jgi:hypothetical protein
MYLRLSLSLLLALAPLGCQSPPATGEPSPEVSYSETRPACAARSGHRNLYFGDLHFHGRYSWDAHAYDTRATPEESYAFARGGGSVRLGPLGADGRGTREVRLTRPLDFAALSDHGEFFGEVELCTKPGSAVYQSHACLGFRGGGDKAVTPWGIRLIQPDGNSRDPDLCGADGAPCRTAAAEVWARLRAAAEAADDKSASCSFVAFPAYEYTASPSVTNQHRNVIFRNAAVPPQPITYYEQPQARGLWSELARQCLDAGTGCDAIVIPHNPNWSNGTLFPSQPPGASLEEQRASARLRARLETVGEFMQHKGDMECSNGFGDPAEAACDFEKLRHPPFEDCGEGSGWGGVKDQGCLSKRDFLRGVMLEGLLDEPALGLNLYRLGVIGSTDSHNGTAGLVEERGFPGHVGTVDDTPEKRLGSGNATHQGLINNPGGLAAVWAVERSRDAIFEALRRRETYSTSGPRISVRFFGGFAYGEGLCSSGDLVAQGYRSGVPMGGVLEGRPAGAGAPRFLLEARRDPGVAGQPGTPLQSAQIVKGWVGADGKPRFKVFEVAGDPKNGAGVDLATCALKGGGAERLCAEWRDPEFDPTVRAFYYARVLENPSCRWSTWDCLALPAASRPAVCSDPALAKTIQERAITSPIWYAPAAR